jgi:hypothetical protein
MPYEAIGNVLAVIAAVVAFTQAGLKGRIVIAVLMGSAFAIPRIIGGQALGFAFLAVRMVIAIGCYLYVRWINAM